MTQMVVLTTSLPRLVCTLSVLRGRFANEFCIASFQFNKYPKSLPSIVTWPCNFQSICLEGILDFKIVWVYNRKAFCASTLK